MYKIISYIFFCCPVLYIQAQTNSSAWVADLGNGTYKNPIIHADYSDPDAIRVGDDYYMISSSFNHIPGIPILHSKDLVHWELIGHVLNKLVPTDHFSNVQHGNGVWAPSLRHHKNEFYIYYPDPNFGIYLVKSKNILGPWTEPILVEEGKGLIDPCPLWDTDGRVYLAHAFAGSRASVKSILVVKELTSDGTKVKGNSVLVYDGHEMDPTIEGPKFYKRNGYYYLFAPAGGVATGWQTVLRSKHVYGPYERKKVMEQGNTLINGPHQGSWIQTQNGEDWFIHFQDKGAYGRVVHLQPMKWIKDWPVIGSDEDGDGIGNPVEHFSKPIKGIRNLRSAPPESDEFNGFKIGKQWQWQANPNPVWAFTTGENLKLFASKVPDSTKNLWDLPNLLMQKFPAEEFSATVKIFFHPRLEGDKAGLIIFGTDYAGISLTKKTDGVYIILSSCLNAEKGMEEQAIQVEKAPGGGIYLRVTVKKGAVCTFSYSADGINFIDAGAPFTAKPGKWVGAKVGLFCTRKAKTNDSGYVDVDWFRVEPLK